tara:strand:- start:349 stop:645 length:297 start_codon:yes stop_codon:yes gene_type:complete
MIVHVLSVLIFSVLYYVLDTYMLDPITKKQPKEVSEKEKGTYIYWLWFAVITQTTVGYGFFNHNSELYYRGHALKHDLFKIVNIIQCFSIFLLTSLFI